LKRALSGYSSGVDATPKLTGRISRAPVIFAVVGLVIALAAGGLYYFRQEQAPPALTPEQTVREFLSAVFVAADVERVAEVVCESWDPADAITRTTKEIDSGVRVSWDEVRVVATSEDRISARARLGLRQRDETQPSAYRQWRFSLVKETRWRVCEARPFIE
jgi:hypothetical protein